MIDFQARHVHRDSARNFAAELSLPVKNQEKQEAAMNPIVCLIRQRLIGAFSRNSVDWLLVFVAFTVVS